MPAHYKDWLEFYRWKKNPFRVKVSGEKNLFVPFEELKISILDRARAENIVNITGATGIGKTEWAHQLRQWLEGTGWVAVYVDLSGTEMDIGTFLRAVWHQLPHSFLARFFSKEVNIEKVLSCIKKVAEKKSVAIILDEAQNIIHKRITDAIRRISDNCENVSFILFSLDDLSKNKIFRESIRRRMSLIPMRGMSLEEAKNLLIKRVRSAGGRRVVPFSQELVEFIWRKSNNVPGLILRYAEDMCIYNARGPRLTTIGPDLAASVLRVPVTPKLELEKPKLKPEKIKPPRKKPPALPKIPATVQAKRVLEVLSPQQQTLLLATKGCGTFMIKELAAKLSMDYKVVSTQMKRINKKVGGDVFVLVKKVGNKKYWRVADNYKTLFSME